MKQKILLIENDKSYSEYLKKTLIDNNYEVITKDSGLKGLDELENQKFDLIISSYYLPNLRGDEFYKRIKDLYPKTPVIFISHETKKKAIKNILEFENADYLVKPVVTTELLAHIEVMLDEHQKTSGTKVLKSKNLELDLNTFTAKRAGKNIDLSPTEFSLLKYLMINKDTVLTRNMILSRIWGYNSNVSSRVVDVYIGYLRDKIDQGHKEKLIETVRGFGYKIKD